MTPPASPPNGRRETAAAIVMFVLIGAVAAFSLIARGDPGGFDRALLLALRTTDGQDPIGPQWLEIAMIDLTALGSIAVAVLVTLATALFLALGGRRATAGFVIAAVFGGILLNNLLKLGFDRSRPDLVAHLVDIHTQSFPSGHAMVAAATWLTLGALLTRAMPTRTLRFYVAGLAVFITLLIGASRIYLGVHWPTDVLAGWCAGAAWAIFCWLAARWLQGYGTIERQAGEDGPAPAPATDQSSRSS